jgi:hypothetical protein
MSKFCPNDRIRVSEDFFWAKGATGTITEPPWEGNLTWQEESAIGVNTVYWVWFDVPQFDADGDGPYRGGQIHENAMSLL